MGGRRRKSAKKTRRGRKVRGGGYGFNQGEPIGVGAAAVTRVSDANFVNSATGQAIPNDVPKVGGRRKSRKASKKGRKSRRKQRGGASGISMGTTYASFTGTGERGIANYAQGTVQGNRF